jgi:hypothetical protein
MIGVRGATPSTGSGTGTTIPVTWTAADAAAGDLAVVMVATQQTLSQTMAAPSGWHTATSAAGNGTNPVLVSVYTKTLDSGDLGATTFPFLLGVSASYVWAMMVYTDAEIALVGAGSETHSTVDGFTMTAPPETGSPGSWILELFGAETSNGAITPNWTAAPSSTGTPSSFVDRGGGVAVTDGVNALGWYDADAGSFVGTTGTVTLPISSAAACSWVGSTVVLDALPGGWGVGQIRWGTA